MFKRALFHITASALLASQVQALSIIPQNDSAALVSTLLGSGISVDAGSINYQGSAAQAGTFTGGLASGLAFDSGILLTTGNAADAVGPNTSSSRSGVTGSGSNAALSTLAGYPTYDSNTLTFNFTSTGGDLFFNYIFASEEYNEYVDSEFNDVFAFFVDGVNIALLPNGDPVSVNTVNCGNPYSGAGPNCASFVNNTDNTNDLQYDGFTKSFTASVQGLSAGTHTMTFAIADASDNILDSAVFLQAGSFSDTPTTEVPEPASLSLLMAGMFGLFLARRKSAANS